MQVLAKQRTRDADTFVAAIKTDYRRADVSQADRAVHEIVQIAGLFNYYTRLADGLGIEPEPEFRER